MKKSLFQKAVVWLMALVMVFGCGSMPAFADTTDAETLKIGEAYQITANKAGDKTWSYTIENAEKGMYITFDESTVLGQQTSMYVYAGEKQIGGTYTGEGLKGKTLFISGNTVKVRLKTTVYTEAGTFKVASITARKVALDLSKHAAVDDIAAVAVDEAVDPVVRVNGDVLKKGEDYTISNEKQSQAGSYEVTINGIGDYTGTLTQKYTVYDESTPATTDVEIKGTVRLRQNGDKASASIPLNKSSAWSSKITSVKLEPVDKADETGKSVAVKTAEGKDVLAVTLEKSDLKVNGSNLTFTRTAENPIVYVMSGKNPVKVGRNTWPQSQIYRVTAEATGYSPVVGYVTYYTGTAPEFSIIIDEDGNPETTNDQKVVKSWTAADLEKKATFANGSSQCGMTGFRTFSGMGVSLKDLLKEANVTVSDSDYFLLDTSDHYGNKFTYDDLFGATRYFTKGIYDKDFVEEYNRLVQADSDSGAVVELRRYLAEKCLKDNSTTEARINTAYVEEVIEGKDLPNAVLPTEENVTFNSLVNYENQFRFIYGLKLDREDCTVTFDTQGGSEVNAQTVKSNLMTSTENTTIKSSFWANSLVIYRNAGEEHKSTPSTAADRIAVPKKPTRDGYTFGGWYTDKDCTAGHRFDFNANNGTVDKNTTLYAKWIPETTATVVDFDLRTDHAGEAVNNTDTQTVYASLTFNKPVILKDKDALAEEMSKTMTFGGAKLDGSDGYGKIENLKLSEDGKTLTFEINGWFAAYSGRLLSDGNWENLVTKESDEAVYSGLNAIVPNGITTKITANTVATASQKASVTTQIIKPKDATRGMVHLTALKNGQPIGALNGNGATATSHCHMYLTMPAADLAKNFAGAIQTALGTDYTVTSNGDQITITAKKSDAGDILELHIASYLNDGSKQVSVDGLAEEINADQNIKASTYTVKSYAVYAAALARAKAIKNDATYYAATDVKDAISSLAAARKALVKEPLNQTITTGASAYTKTLGAKAFTLGAKATGKLTYKTSNSKVATVDKNGKITVKGVGAANITVSAAATGNYKAAAKTVKITVNPKSTSLSSAKSTSKKKLTTKWKKNKAVTGYQIQYATNKSFTNAKVKTIKGASKTSYKISKLTSKKTYYARVRTYKTVSGKNYYGSWSSAKKAKVK